jgi:SAM-dependent methyltransferase
MIDPQSVIEHYGYAGLGDAILAALKAAGKDIDHLTPDDLAPVDEFHTRGRAATMDLARLLALRGDELILDIGSGIGGPSRYLAKTFGCRVAGLDLTPEFCNVAAMLAARTGLADKVAYRQGNALAMPFEDKSFDVAWSQNAVMNIDDRDRLYGEIRRVLKPDGRYAFSDVVAGPGGPPHFPLPWAHDPSTSFLLTADATREKFEAAGLRVIAFDDTTAQARTHAQERADAATSPSGLGVHILLGKDSPVMYRNGLRNFAEDRIGLIQGLVVRAD